MKKADISRRSFLGKAATVGAAGIVVPSIITACSRDTKSKKIVPAVAWNDQAPDGPVLKAGLIGCGGRGKGAALQFIAAGPNLQVTALGDTFKDRLEDAREAIKKAGQEVADEKCFIGFDAYQKVIDSGVDVVILATPPFFRPEHFSAAVAARKHVFMEKPVCVDPAGARSVMATALKAKELELSVVTGTQRRHQRDYNAIWAKVQEGAIGDIVSAECYWNQSQLWYRDPVKEWSEMEYMIRDWVNWSWLSGDHIVEQHVHNIDVINWFTGSHPVKAVSFGSRQRRKTGDQFDNFSTDFIFENGMHLHSMCRQINGCENNVSEVIHGSDGWMLTADRRNCELYDKAGNIKWQFDGYVPDKDGKPTHKVKVDPYNQEHIDLVTSIRNNKPVNEAEDTAISTLTAIMGRISAYTGKMVTWDEMLNSDLKLGPKVFEFGKVDVPKDVPVPGEGDKTSK
jgi:myo-inositol 2-dehydrogenase / D-chiro-inositol 1-dehydrogenase